MTLILGLCCTIGAFNLTAEELPSSTFLKSEQAVQASAEAQSSLSIYGATPVASKQRALYSLYVNSDSDWDDPFNPGGGAEEGTGEPGVTGPIGETSPLVIFLLGLFYFVYRGVTVSKRRNNL